MLLGKSTLLTGNGMEIEENKVADESGSFYRTPTPEEFARVNNFNINTEVDTSKLGKVGKLSDLDDDDDEWNGGGGFLWSL